MIRKRVCEHDVSIIQKTGIFHMKENKDNEDVVSVVQEKELLILGIADGQSGKKYCREGAEICLDTIAEYIKENGFEEIYSCVDADKCKYEFMKRVEDSLTECVKKESIEIKEFSSTFLVIAMDMKTRKYIIFHLGDGSVIGVTGDGRSQFLSVPENGVNLHTTWYATSRSALSHVRVKKGTFVGLKRILMITDGVDCISSGKNISMRFRKICMDHVQKIADYVEQREAADDSSCIILDL